MPEFHPSGGEDPLSAALKHAATQSGRQVLPLPVEEIEARGTRRRRATLALAAACAVCVLSGASALAALNLTAEQPPARPVPSLTPPPSLSGTPSSRSRFASPSAPTTSAEVSSGSAVGGVPSGTPSFSSGTASPFTTPPFGSGIGSGPSVMTSPGSGADISSAPAG
ncbi:hypothetical protein [Streptomyces sp. 35G-GA-8]|uniref:hypothetical protein n=1 Tax=Streptomyces sp. 35G-GA-8 TaxID=2939434 RepID=UPI00201F3DFF|nr:hypothetical protein [Streptomyces sp. 35G-GA-8]MCL7380778.1 hypothetical protein [Streptomyces sp. 35G-GA-8]